MNFFLNEQKANTTYPHMNLNIRYFSLTNSTFIILDTSMNFSIMFEHFGQGIKPQRTIWALVIFGIWSVAFSMSFHPFWFPRPKGTSSHVTIHPLIIWGFEAKVCQHWGISQGFDVTNIRRFILEGFVGRGGCGKGRGCKRDKLF